MSWPRARRWRRSSARADRTHPGCADDDGRVHRADRGRPAPWPIDIRGQDVEIPAAPGPIVTLNRAVAVAEVRGPQAALKLIEPLLDDQRLRRNHRLHAVDAHLLELAGRADDARAAYLLAVRTSAIDAFARPVAHTATERTNVGHLAWSLRVGLRIPQPIAQTLTAGTSLRVLGGRSISTAAQSHAR